MGLSICKKYKPLWETKCNYIIVTGGRGSAKSFTISDFLENLTFERGHTILFTRYTLTSAHISIIPEFQEKIDLEGHNDCFNVNKTEISNTKTGSAILFRGIRTSAGNQTANLKSIKGLTTWVLDEAEELTDEDTFDKIDESIRNPDKQNRVIIVMNPTHKNHFIYQRFFEEAGVNEGFNGEKDGVCYIHTDYLDNSENLSKKFLDTANKVKGSNIKRYNHRYLGKWLERSEGVIYTNWEYGKFDPNAPMSYGLDFGSTDPDAMLKVGIDKDNKCIYLDECFYETGNTPTQLYDLVKKNVNNRSLIVADSAGKRMIDMLKPSFNIKGIDKSKFTLEGSIRDLQDFKFIVTDSSKNIAKELNNYTWHDKRANIPIDDYNHLLDALRYAVMDYLYPSKPMDVTWSN